MSTTTLFDTSPRVLAPLPFDHKFWVGLKGRDSERWAGVGRKRWHCFTFSIQLPGQVVEAFTLRNACRFAVEHRDDLPWGQVRRPMLTLATKLEEALGYPNETLLYKGSEGFRQAIRDNPGELANWASFADWLQEHGHPEGVVIFRWLGGQVYSQKQAKADQLAEYLRRRKESRG